MTRTVLLGDLVDISSSKRIFYKEYVNSGVPFYRSKEIIEKAIGNKDISTELFISEERFVEIESKFGAPKEGDLLLTSVGTLGIPYIVQKKERFYFKDGNLTWFRDFKPELNQNYLLYWLTSQGGKNELENHTIGSTQKALTIQGLKKVKVPLPTVEAQKKIADILGTIDEKIELNRQMNETLEQMGQTLFKHYFITNPESKTWPKGKLGDIITNFDSKRIPLSSRERDIRKGPYRYFGATSVMDYVDDFLFDGKYLLLAEDGSVIRKDGTPFLQYVWGKFWANNHTHILQAKTPFTVEYLYLLLKNMNVQSLVSGAVQLKINQGAMNSFPLHLPPTRIVDKFTEIINPLFDQFRENEEAIQTLTRLRDSLLPRLISGKIKV